MMPSVYDRAFSMFGKARVEHRVARFRQINMDDPHVHHDALEFPGGHIVMVTRLVPGQTATVLQLPAETQHHGKRTWRKRTCAGRTHRVAARTRTDRIAIRDAAASRRKPCGGRPNVCRPYRI